MDWKKYMGLTSRETIKRPMEMILQEKHEAASAQLRGEKIPEPGEVEFQPISPRAFTGIDRTIHKMKARQLQAVDFQPRESEKESAERYRAIEEEAWKIYDLQPGDTLKFAPITKPFKVNSFFKPDGPMLAKVVHVSNKLIDCNPIELGMLVRCFWPGYGAIVGHIFSFDQTHFVVKDPRSLTTCCNQDWFRDVFPESFRCKPEIGMHFSMYSEERLVRGVIDRIEDKYAYGKVEGGRYVFFDLKMWMRDLVWPTRMRESDA